LFFFTSCIIDVVWVVIFLQNRDLKGT